MGRRLERHINWDLTERILASGPIKKQPVTKTKKTPRHATSYRGHRRNAHRGSVWHGADARRDPVIGEPRATLNRSAKWRSARTYAEARAMSPYPSMPVR